MQILGITGNNASNNDKMIEHLSNMLDNFPGPANQTQCFVHTVNLIAKLILKPFDIRKNKDVQAFNDAAHALTDSVVGHKMEQAAHDEEGKDDDEDEDENKDNEFDAGLKPIWSMLLKVCLFTCQTLKLLMNIEASEIFIHTQELDNEPLASVVQNPFHLWPSPMYDALRRINLLELHL
jgi:hypothetical protein